MEERFTPNTPRFYVVRIGSGGGVPEPISRGLLVDGIPGGLIGYEYRPLQEAVFLDGLGGNGLVAIAKSGLMGVICIDVPTKSVVHVPKIGSSIVNYVNANLSLFSNCVSAVISRYPFYEEGEDGEFERVADEVREVVLSIDGTAFSGDSFWGTFCDDIEMGSYAS